jgi:hypothetical protein
MQKGVTAVLVGCVLLGAKGVENYDRSLLAVGTVRVLRNFQM